MVKIRDIKNKYDRCLSKAIKWLNDNGYIVGNRSPIFKYEYTNNTKDEVNFLLNEALHFKDWPFRGGSTEKLQILADVIETVSLKGNTATSTKVTSYLNYFKIDKRNRGLANAIESIRFDFCLQIKEKHPICHAQNCNKILQKILDKKPESFKWDVNEKAIKNRCANIKIPSAFINMPGLLVILSADHMNTIAHWQNFITECKNDFEEIPTISHRIIETSIPNGKCRAWTWYDL